MAGEGGGWSQYRNCDGFITAARYVGDTRGLGAHFDMAMIERILTFLPTVSLYRFQCVSKDWRNAMIRMGVFRDSTLCFAAICSEELMLHAGGEFLILSPQPGCIVAGHGTLLLLLRFPTLLLFDVRYPLHPLTVPYARSMKSRSVLFVGLITESVRFVVVTRRRRNHVVDIQVYSVEAARWGENKSLDLPRYEEFLGRMRSYRHIFSATMHGSRLYFFTYSSHGHKFIIRKLDIDEQRYPPRWTSFIVAEWVNKVGRWDGMPYGECDFLPKLCVVSGALYVVSWHGLHELTIYRLEGGAFTALSTAKIVTNDLAFCVSGCDTHILVCILYSRFVFTYELATQEWGAVEMPIRPGDQAAMVVPVSLPLPDRIALSRAHPLALAFKLGW